jgi:serine/threonine protein kinase
LTAEHSEPSAQPDQEEPSFSFAEGDQIVGDLRAWELLGDGLRCETWLAWDAARWHPVAVKLPRPDRLDSQSTLAALRREATVTAQLRHPGIQRLLDDRLDHPLLPHLVFEYVEGPALIDLIEEDGHLSVADLALLGMQVASVLHFLHGRGLAHLDLKPHNLVVRRGLSILIDFGHARGLGLCAPPGRPRGSPPYMAPEQCRREPASPAMDLFALGAVLYEAATGQIAFDSGSDVFLQLAEPPRPTALLRPHLPPRLAALIDGLLDPDPGLRPTTGQVLVGLASVLPAKAPRLWPPFVDGLSGQLPVVTV